MGPWELKWDMQWDLQWDLMWDLMWDRARGGPQRAEKRKRLVVGDQDIGRLLRAVRGLPLRRPELDQSWLAA